MEFPPLPAPRSVTASSPADRAREIVEAIRAGGGEGALAAITAAFLESGIPVVGSDGNQLAAATAEEGFAIEAWELRLLADVDPTRGAGMLLSDFGETLAALEPDAPDTDLGQLLLEAIQAAAEDPDPTVQTAALILAELGRQRDGFDLMTATDPAEVTLDAVQSHLILFRLGNDVLVATTRLSANRPVGVLAVARPPSLEQGRNQAASPPCQYSSTDNKIIGGMEKYMTTAIKGFTFFDKRVPGILDLFGKANDGNLTRAEKYARGLKFAGMFADLAKMFAALAMLKADVVMEGGEPLIRTKNAQPGQQKTLVATARLDPGNAQIINCFRLMFAAAGAKFSIPQAEVLSDRPATWHALEGFGGKLVQFRGDPIHQRTDASGRARIIVEGVPHKPPVPASAQAVEKHASVRFHVAIKDTSLGRDLKDAAGVAMSGPLAPIKAALELIYRTTIPAATYRFAVRDWDLPDYRIDKTVTYDDGFTSYTIQYTGTKCDGPVGEWAIDSAGTLTGGGDTATLGGTIFVQIGEASNTGQMGGTARFTDVDPDGTTTTEGIFGGTGTFNPAAPEMVLNVTTGGGNGYVYGFLDTGPSQPGTLTFPVEVGDFCE